MTQPLQFPRKLLAASICAATLGYGLSAPAVFAQDQRQMPIEEVIITGSFRDSLANALNIKRNNTAAIDSIVADDIASFPDNNLAEAMQRIPGVNIDRVGGEGRTISVRGLSPEFTRVRINGMETISTGIGNRGRGFDFNIFASELFNRIDVRKSQSAEVDEGSLGATVDLYTGRPMDHDGFVFVTSAQLGYNDQSESVDPRVTGLVSFSNDEGNLGALFSLAYSEREVSQVGHNSGRWERNRWDPDDEVNVNSIHRWANYEDLPLEVNRAVHPRFPRQWDRTLEIKRLGLTGSLQWAPTDRTMVTLDALYADIGTVQTDLTLTPISLARTGATGVNETTVNDYIYDPSNNGLIYADLSGVDVRSENFRQDWTTKFHQVSLAVEHEFTDVFRMKGLIGTSESDHKVHSETTAIFEAFNQDMTYDYRNGMASPIVTYGFDPADPSVWLVSELRDRPSDTKNTFDTIRVDAEYDFRAGNVDMTLKGGVSYKEFFFDNNQYQRDRSVINQNNHTDLAVSVPAGCGITLADLEVDSSMGSLHRPSGGLPTYFLPNLNAIANQYNLFTDSTCFPSVLNPGSDRSVKEEDLGFYVQLDFTTDIGGMPFRGDVGVREVETKQTSRGILNGEDATIKRDYTDTLPSINLVLEPVDDVLLRASWSEVMSRPSLGQLTPGGTVDRFNWVVNTGNPVLDPFRAKATDLSVEWYFAEESMLSLAYFHKDIESFAASDRISGVPWSFFQSIGFSDELLAGGPATVNDNFEFRSSVNTDGGKLDGWEIQYQQPFAFGPDWVRNFGIKANYTYIESEIYGGTATDGSRIIQRLNGQSKISWNTTLWYENNAGFAGRVSLSHRDPYQRNSQSTAGPGADTKDSVRVVDAALSYQLNDNVKLTFDALNLTDEPETDLQSDYNFVENELFSGRQYYLGVQYTY